MSFKEKVSMKKRTPILLALVLCLFLTIPAYSAQADTTEQVKPKPIEAVSDIMAWKSIRASVLSNNGEWFAYILAPQEGDGEVIIQQTKGEKEFRFPIGESPRYGGSSLISFSEDSLWAAYTIFPKREEARKLKKQKKKVYNDAKAINLKSGQEYEFEKVNKFSFSRENPGWLALHKYPSEDQSKSEDNQSKSEDKWSGSDLLLFDLKTAEPLNIGNVSEFAFNKKGDLLAWAIDAQGKSGNGVQLRNMSSGVIAPIENDKAVYKKLTWTEKGDGLTVLKGKEDEGFENKLFCVIGFYNFSSSGPQKISYVPGKDKSFPEKMTISPNRNPVWTDDLSGILFGIHELEEKKDKKKKSEDTPKTEEIKGKDKTEKPEDKTEKPKEKPEKDIDKQDLPGLVIWHWLDKRIQPMQQVQEKRDKNFSYLCIYRVKENKFLRLANDKVREVTAAPKHLWAIGQDNSQYELDGNLYGRRYNDIYVIDLKTGEQKLALKKCRWFFSPSPDGSHFLYYKGGDFHTYEMATGKTYNITEEVPTSFINTEDDNNVIDPPIYPRLGWTKGGESVLLYDNWDVWNIPVHGEKGVNLTVNGKKEQIRFQRRFRLDPEEKGIDLSKPLYLSAYEEWTKKSGIARIDNGKPGEKMLCWDDAVYSLLKAKKAEVYLYTRQTYKDYPDYYVSGRSLKKGKKITEANPQQKNFLWSDGCRLIDYTSDKGDKLQAALFLPANYEKGKNYPTIVYYYEKLSQRMNNYYAPAARGFNKSVYTSRGYAVLMPDIVYQLNDPGMSAVWCVLPAVKAAADTGVVDINRVGIHGHSWGGYQTAFLITQTDMFKAAIAGAPLTNMISMYSSVYWNSGSANQPIFESSQGRFKGNYLDNLDAYTRNSPVYYANNVNTPLIILHNDKDGAVDWNQGIEYYNTLRQLKKSVIMLQYKGENHGLRKQPNMKDYYMRMREFFDHHLMGKPAPKWLQQGISHLDHEKHIKERTKIILKKKKDEKKK